VRVKTKPPELEGSLAEGAVLLNDESTSRELSLFPASTKLTVDGGKATYDTSKELEYTVMMMSNDSLVHETNEVLTAWVDHHSGEPDT
jgi:hypothetical protein